jgi:hypothetical protein
MPDGQFSAGQQEQLSATIDHILFEQHTGGKAVNGNNCHLHSPVSRAGFGLPAIFPERSA